MVCQQDEVMSQWEMQYGQDAKPLVVVGIQTLDGNRVDSSKQVSGAFSRFESFKVIEVS